MALTARAHSEETDTKGPDSHADRATSLSGCALSESETDLMAKVIEAFLRRHPDEDTGMIERAAETAATAHAGQVRRSGEPYITHPIAVAGIVAELGLDTQTIAAAL